MALHCVAFCGNRYEPVSINSLQPGDQFVFAESILWGRFYRWIYTKTPIMREGKIKIKCGYDGRIHLIEDSTQVIKLPSAKFNLKNKVAHALFHLIA